MQQPIYPRTRTVKTNRTGHPLCRVKTTGAPAKPGDYLAYWGAWQNKYKLIRIVGMWGASAFRMYGTHYSRTWHVQRLGSFYADGRTKPATNPKIRPVACQAQYMRSLRPVVPVRGVKLVKYIKPTAAEFTAYKAACEVWLAARN